MSRTNGRPPGTAHRKLGYARLSAGTAVLSLILALLVLSGASRLDAQGVGQLAFTGTIYTNLGQPVPVGTPITAVTALTNVPCGQGVTGPSGSYSITITAASPCNAVGTSLIFKVNSLAASPTAFVTTSSGVVLLQLTVAGLQVNTPAATNSGSVLTPPASPPPGSGTAPQASSGALIPPTTPPAQSATQANSAATASAAPSGQPAQVTGHTVSLPLTSGCNQVVVALGAGAKPQMVVSAVVDPTAVLSIWHFDNASQHYSGYFPGQGVPSDLTALNSVDSVFICVSGTTTINAPQP